MNLSQAQSNLFGIRTHQDHRVIAHSICRVDHQCFMEDHGDQSATDHDDKPVGVLPVQGLRERKADIQQSICCYESVSVIFRAFCLLCINPSDGRIDQEGLCKLEGRPTEPWDECSSEL